jgi:hypothetical protein
MFKIDTDKTYKLECQYSNSGKYITLCLRDRDTGEVNRITGIIPKHIDKKSKAKIMELNADKPYITSQLEKMFVGEPVFDTFLSPFFYDGKVFATENASRSVFGDTLIKFKDAFGDKVIVANTKRTKRVLFPKTSPSSFYRDIPFICGKTMYVKNTDNCYLKIENGIYMLDSSYKRGMWGERSESEILERYGRTKDSINNSLSAGNYLLADRETKKIVFEINNGDYSDDTWQPVLDYVFGTVDKGGKTISKVKFYDSKDFAPDFSGVEIE